MRRSLEKWRHPNYSERIWKKRCPKCNVGPGEVCINLRSLLTGPACSHPHKERRKL